jgi:hypothetical protein
VPTDNKFMVDFSLLYLAMILSNYGHFSFLYMAMSLSKVHWYFTTFPVFFCLIRLSGTNLRTTWSKSAHNMPLEPLELPKSA